MIKPFAVIRINGKKYLTRFYLLLRDWTFFNIYIHHFHMSDQKQQLHNHPWKWSFSFVLFGGYLEETCTREEKIIRQRIVPSFSFNFIKNKMFHRVDLLNEKKGAWTLFIAGPRTATWGFLDRDTFEFTDWKENPEAIP